MGLVELFPKGLVELHFFVLIIYLQLLFDLHLIDKATQQLHLLSGCLSVNNADRFTMHCFELLAFMYF